MNYAGLGLTSFYLYLRNNFIKSDILKYYITALCFRDYIYIYIYVYIYMHKVIIFNEVNKRKPIIIHLHLEQGFLLLFVLQSATKTEPDSD